MKTEAGRKLIKCLESVRETTDFTPEIAVVLGSGLGNLAESIDVRAAVNYADIPDFPTATAEGHAGRFVFGYAGDVPVVMMQGRIHYYEGYPMTDVVLPTRLAGLLGAKKIILTNAAGGVNYGLNPGDLMLITDQILFGVPNPLIGQNDDGLGTRFPDMSEIYSIRMRGIAKQAAAKLSINLKEGVYVQFSGPSYETPAEIRLCRTMGGAAVGMSTACEAIAARHMGMEVCGISCITNLAAGMSGRALSHKEVQESADMAAEQFSRLLKAIIEEA